MYRPIAANRRLALISAKIIIVIWAHSLPSSYPPPLSPHPPHSAIVTAAFLHVVCIRCGAGASDDICLSLGLPTSLYAYLNVRLTTCLSVCLPVCPTTYLSWMTHWMPTVSVCRSHGSVTTRMLKDSVVDDNDSHDDSPDRDQLTLRDWFVSWWWK